MITDIWLCLRLPPSEPEKPQRMGSRIALTLGRDDTNQAASFLTRPNASASRLYDFLRAS